MLHALSHLQSFRGVPNIDKDPSIVYYEKDNISFTANIYKYISSKSVKTLCKLNLRNIKINSLIVNKNYMLALVSKNAEVTLIYCERINIGITF